MIREKNFEIAGGYSLIELLVVLTLFAILVLISTQTLILSLRSANKSESVGKVKENVEYAVSIIERQLRNAREVPVCPNPDTLIINYLDHSGQSASFSCVDPGDAGYIASGSARLTNEDVSVTSCSMTCILTPGAPPQVSIKITAKDNTSLSGAEGAQATSETNVLLRQY